MWSGLEHPNIVRLLGFHLDMQDDVKGDANRDVMWLVSRWEPFGNIVDYLSRNEVDELTKLQLVSREPSEDFQRLTNTTLSSRLSIPLKDSLSFIQGTPACAMAISKA